MEEPGVCFSKAKIGIGGHIDGIVLTKSYGLPELAAIGEPFLNNIPLILARDVFQACTVR